jgi:hypothetical protein
MSELIILGLIPGLCAQSGGKDGQAIEVPPGGSSKRSLPIRA